MERSRSPAMRAAGGGITKQERAVGMEDRVAAASASGSGSGRQGEIRADGERWGTRRGEGLTRGRGEVVVARRREAD